MSKESDFGAVATTLSFLASVIKSGEPWTPTCEEKLSGAFDALDRLSSLIALSAAR